MTTDDAPNELSAEHTAVAGRTITALAGAGATLRPDQRRAVAALAVPGSRVLVVQATGWGKSAVYWAATAIHRFDGAGPTLVVSPLLSLMRDQVAAAEKAGLTAVTINSSNVDEWATIESAIHANTVDVVLVSPERLANPSFGRRVLDALGQSLGMLVIDEAHAISDWGHDFRPDYRRVADVLAQAHPDTPVLATTATANARVTDDVATQLGDTTMVLRGPLARTSLQLNVCPDMSPLDRYAWVAEHIASLPGSGIVYVLTVADADRVAQAISAVHPDTVAVATYTGALDGDERHRREDALRNNTIKALIATSALGMGYDKPDLGFVVHVGAPPSPVSYYQQVGRAGRGIDNATVVLLPSHSDVGIWDHFATATIPDPDQMHRVIAALNDAEEPQSSVSLEAGTRLRRTKIDLMLKQLAVDGSVERYDGGWRTTGVPWTYDASHYDGIIATRQREADIMRSYMRGERCLMALLIDSLDDPDARPCGRCSVCRGALTDGLAAAPSSDTARAIATALRTRAHELAPRKMWPGGAFGSRGRIAANSLAETGRVLIDADAPEWTDTLDMARRGDDSGIDEIGSAAITTLAGWRASWIGRPQVVVSITTDTTTIADRVAREIARVGRLPHATQSLTSVPSAPRDASGGDEAAAWRDALAQAPSDVAGQRVVLVVDQSRTGWAITVTAAHLRAAGATAVLPLLVHRPA